MHYVLKSLLKYRLKDRLLWFLFDFDGIECLEKEEEKEVMIWSRDEMTGGTSRV